MSRSVKAAPERYRVGGSRGEMRRRLWQQRYLLLFLLPVLTCLILFSYIPLGGIVIAFKDYKLSDGFYGGAWVGLKYFREFFTSPMFAKVLRNTVSISFLNLLFAFPIPIAFALFLNEIDNKRYLKIVQTVSYLPHFLSWVVVISIFSKLLSFNGGVINVLLERLGGEPINFFGKKNWIWPIAVFTRVWKEMGWDAIVYIAALAGIEQEQYEAACIDGAGRLQRIWHISLPGIKATIILLFIMNMGNVMSSSLDQIYLLNNPATIDVAEVIDTYVFQRSLFNMDYSFGTAVGLFKSAVNLLLVFSFNALFKRTAGESLI